MPEGISPTPEENNKFTNDNEVADLEQIRAEKAKAAEEAKTLRIQQLQDAANESGYVDPDKLRSQTPPESIDKEAA